MNDDNLEAVIRLEHGALAARTASERAAEAVTNAAGTTACVVTHAAAFALWVVANTGIGHLIKPFDPFPFSLLTFVVSLEAIFLTLLVLMSQKRLMRESDKRAILDLQINILAEQESTKTLRMVRCICEHLGIKDDQGAKAESSLEKTTNVERLAKEVEQSMPS